MWIKFKVEGELEELIKAESEDECRTCSQQALYVLKNYYKNKKIGIYIRSSEYSLMN